MSDGKQQKAYNGPGTTRRGNPARKAPKHKNKFAFKHNKHSRKTKFIANLPTAREQGSGLCVRCSQIIAWRKQYRKYKPMREAHKCATCGERKVTLAYHVICSDCAHASNTCPKCRSKPEALDEDKDPDELDEDDVLEVLSSASLKQRQRRTIMRRFEQGNLTVHDLQKILGEDTKGDDDEEDSDSGGEHEDEKEADDDEEDDAETDKPKPPKPTDAEMDITHADDWKVFDDDYDEAKQETALRARLGPGAAAAAAGAEAKAAPAAAAGSDDEGEGEGEGDDDADEGDAEGEDDGEGEGDDDGEGEGEGDDDDDGEGEGEGDDADSDEGDDDGDDAADGSAAASSSGAAAAAVATATASASASAPARGKKAVEPLIDGARIKSQGANKLAARENALRAMNAQARVDKERGRMQQASGHTHAAMKAKAAGGKTAAK